MAQGKNKVYVVGYKKDKWYTPGGVAKLPFKTIMTFFGYALALFVLALIVGAILVVVFSVGQAEPYQRFRTTVRTSAAGWWQALQNIANPGTLAANVEQKWKGKNDDTTPQGILVSSFGTSSRRTSFNSNENIVAKFVLKVSGDEIKDRLVEKRLDIDLNCSVVDDDLTQIAEVKTGQPYIEGRRETWVFTCTYPVEVMEEFIKEGNESDLALLGDIKFETSSESTLKVYYIKEELQQNLDQENLNFWEAYPAIRREEKEAPEIPYHFKNDPIHLSLRAVEDHIQPIVVSQNPDLQPFVALGLSSNWDGTATEFKKIILKLPRGVGINFDMDKGGLPRGLAGCPFDYQGVEGDQEIFSMPQEFLKDLGEIAGGTQEAKTIDFLCKLDIPYSSLDRKPWTDREYEAYAEYVYQQSPKKFPIKLKKV